MCSTSVYFLVLRNDDHLGGEQMDELIKQAKNLRQAIKYEEKKIDNPALTLGILSELDLFIENVEEVD